MKRKISHRVRITAVFLITTLLFITACQSDDAETASIPVPIPAEEVQAQAIGSEPYDIVMSVITSPRCMNCHPSDDRPRQRDEQVVHILNVQRGEDNHNGPVQTCDTCHHEENNEYSNAPGAPHWGLAPKSMGWLGKSNAEIAQALLDPALNGGRSHEDLLHHMSEDALVLWAWEPGEGRTPPPVPHDEFVAALEAWLAAGAPIPSE